MKEVDVDDYKLLSEPFLASNITETAVVIINNVQLLLESSVLTR